LNPPSVSLALVATLILRCSWQRLHGQPVHAQCRMSAAKTGKTEETYLLYHNWMSLGSTLISASLQDPQTFRFEHLDR
jgi:hypothetical protein